MSWLERELGAPTAWLGEMPERSRYTYGLAGERFFRALKDEGKILGARCPHCDVLYVPGRAFCERCLRRLDVWLDVGTRGQVYTFTLLYEDLDGRPRPEPEVVAFVRMGDGGIIHRLGEVTPDEVTIGMEVEALPRPAKERQGSILDISHFRPVRR
ncbi:MAG: Zn-ribbon domain-containing OB-fold protein [Chloroflexota bacterium]